MAHAMEKAACNLNADRIQISISARVYSSAVTMADES